MLSPKYQPVAMKLLPLGVVVEEGQGLRPPQPTALLAFNRAVLQSTFLLKLASLPVCASLAPVVLRREVSRRGDMLQFSASFLGLACLGSPPSALGVAELPQSFLRQTGSQGRRRLPLCAFFSFSFLRPQQLSCVAVREQNHGPRRAAAMGHFLCGRASAGVQPSGPEPKGSPLSPPASSPLPPRASHRRALRAARCWGVSGIQFINSKNCRFLFFLPLHLLSPQSKTAAASQETAP